MRRCIYICMILVTFASCNDGTSLMNKITGKPGETVVVVSDELWKSPLGDSLFSILTKPVPSLPQSEPILDAIHIVPNGFTDIFKTTRNIILVNVSSSVDTSAVLYRKNIWAAPQLVITFKAKNKKDLATLIAQHKDKLPNTILKMERKRLVDTYKKEEFSNDGLAKYFEKKYNCSIRVPNGYDLSVDTTNFSWVRYETRDLSQAFFVWTTPYTSEENFSSEYQMQVADSLMKKYIEGPSKGSYMAMEKRLNPTKEVIQFNGNYGVKMSGLWRVEGDFMGGPWKMLSVLDVKNKQIVTIMGYVYVPRYDKRNYLRQIEAIMYTMKFPHQKDNDKINHVLKSSVSITETKK